MFFVGAKVSREKDIDRLGVREVVSPRVVQR